MQVHIDGVPANLDILDTAGQEEFSGLRSSYMRAGQGYLIVYSVADRHSFEATRQFRDEIVRAQDRQDVPIVLVGNKCDIAAQRAVSGAFTLLCPFRFARNHFPCNQYFQVPTAEGQALAKSLGCGFMECSAKLRLHIDDTFSMLVRLVRDDQARLAKSNILRNQMDLTDARSVGGKRRRRSRIHQTSNDRCAVFCVIS
eukprot:c4604_g1_i1.p1 GENE.c4604_g1_i1~~c4604_g1_i1.p1  ORF type:complete len:199 (-),score=27.78 c4604_g1_i1:86-682(-)